MKILGKIAVLSSLEFTGFISWRGNMVNPTFTKLHAHTVHIEIAPLPSAKSTWKPMGKGLTRIKLF